MNCKVGRGRARLPRDARLVLSVAQEALQREVLAERARGERAAIPGSSSRVGIGFNRLSRALFVHAVLMHAVLRSHRKSVDTPRKWY